MKSPRRINSFNFPEGYVFDGKFKIISKLGGGWEGEVYRVQELLTGIERAAKFFLPHRNRGNRSATFYAKKLHRLRHCSILIHYLTVNIMDFEGVPVTYLISEYVEGITLGEFIDLQKGKRLNSFQALHLLYALAKGISEIHKMKEYHGDLHTGNVIVQRHGLGFDLKLVDMYNWGKVFRENYQSDICNLIRIFYDSLGGAKYYSKQPKEIKEIACGLKQTLILTKFNNIFRLTNHLENMEWD